MKMRLVILCCLVLATVAVTIAFSVQRRERREIDATVFDAMRKNPWDLNGDLLWGFFFTNDSRGVLEITAKALEIVGYKIVAIYQDEQKKFWWLHVERVERLTLDSMASRNVRLIWFAKLFGGSVYDGWDVGQVGWKPKANQPSEPTAMSVTPPAAQEPRQP